jgi:hypothetical protein
MSDGSVSVCATAPPARQTVSVEGPRQAVRLCDPRHDPEDIRVALIEDLAPDQAHTSPHASRKLRSQRLLHRCGTITVMSVAAGASILKLDAHGFASAFARRPYGVNHTLVSHPLLQLDALAELADRYPGRIERHRADLPLVMPGGAPELEGPPSETVRGIDHNGCWMVFWYIDQVPEYKAILDRCVDEAESCLPPYLRRTLQREAFLFLSAPNALTPVHFDPEHNFLLQIRGWKDMNCCAFPSLEAEQFELERYYSGGHRNLDAMPSEGECFRLEPGKGVYVPSFMPHWVQNGSEASISLSLTFRTPESLRAERVQTVNARLRRLRLSPRPPGASPRIDRAKEVAWLTASRPKHRIMGLKRALGNGHVPSSN